MVGIMVGVGDLRARLAEVVGPAHVLTDPDLVGGYEVDWTGRFQGRARAVVRPADAAEVAAVLRICADAGAAVVAQGGNTGLVGGSVPLAGEVVLSLRRLARLDDVDPLALQVTAGAGVTLERLQDHAAAAGFRFPLDLGARGSATVGGMIATNAGGVHVVRHGPMRSLVAGVEAVRSNGEVVSHLAGLDKDNTGYDLAGALCGSEGTLAVVTRARLRVIGPPGDVAVALASVDDGAAAVELAGYLRRVEPAVTALEVVFPEAVRLVADHLGSEPPLPSDRPIVLVELEADADAALRLAERLGEAGDRLRDAVVASEPGGQLRLWRWRESVTEAISSVGVPHKLDVTLPADRLAAFCDEVPGVVADRAPDARTVLFGHVGDGNIHVNVLGLDPADDRVDVAVLELVASFGGSISAEHGIGTAKAPLLHLSRSESERQLFLALRTAWDPAGILNPAVLVPLPDDGPS